MTEVDRGTKALGAIQREQRLQTLCLLGTAAVLAGFALYWLRDALMPLTVAVLLAYLVNPLVDGLVRLARLPRPLAVGMALILGAMILFLLWVFVWTSVGQMLENSTLYMQRLEELWARLLARFPVAKLSHGSPRLADLIANVPTETVGAMAGNLANAILGILSQSSVVFIFLLFLLLGSRTRTGPVVGVWADIGGQVRQYLVAKTLLALLNGSIMGLVLWALGVEMASVFALMTFLLNFIPNIGPIFATLLPLPVVLLSPETSILKVVLAIGVPGTTQFVIGNIVEPRYLGESLDLHPVAVLVALITWYTLWGSIGMVLAVPLTSVLKILFERLDLTRPVARVLAGTFETRGEQGSVTKYRGHFE